jgi:hypothetical protein
MASGLARTILPMGNEAVVDYSLRWHDFILLIAPNSMELEFEKAG